MSKLRRHMGANTPAVVETKRLKDLKAKTGNLYESISIIAKRANLLVIQTVWKKFMRIKSKSKSLKLMSVCQIQRF